jgi:hypothetical protein
MTIQTAGYTTILFAAFVTAAHAAPECNEHVFGIQIDQTAQTLRTLNHDSETRFQERLSTIAKTRGWTEAQKADKAAAAMDDSKLEKFNAEIEELVGQLDALNVTPKNDISCARLNELKAVNDKLIAVMRRKAGFILSELEVAAASAPISPYSPAAPVERSALVEKAAPVEKPAPAQRMAAAPDTAPNVPWSANVAKALRQPQQSGAQTASVSPPAPAPAAPTSLRPGATQESRTASLPPPANDALPRPSAVPAGYSPQEIRNAGEGIFGKLTSEFAVVMNYAFQTYGEPNAYVIGDEGGGAFLAGLRYGEGHLYTRLNGVQTGPTKIYWQGPSLGADIGATGSRALFLVYNLQDAVTLYKRFPGIDGAAYVAGGFGLTVYQNGNMLIVPIRSGLGIRLGASLAYLKFTERGSWNPF